MKGVLSQTARQQRVIRVFISSTFQDMKEEREELVKRVFPRLRRVCEARGVTWGAVDLRWGITNEQQAEGRVLPICLKQIDECSPFFIGILGERYGYIPNEIPDELLKQEPWLEEHSDKSVTELEMLHGVLNDPDKAECAHFYFRDPAYDVSLPQELLTDAPEKLKSLKSRIRGCGVPVRENYSNPKEFGEHVYRDLMVVIDQLFPEGSELDPLDRNTLDHELFASSKFKVYIGRQEYYDSLDRHVESENQPLVVLGESGSGKSALLANWVIKYRQKHPEELVFIHFIGATPYSSDWSAMVRRIMGEFKRWFELDWTIPSKPARLRSAFANWLHMVSTAAGEKNKKVILILDALNQLDDRDSALDLVWLPPLIPENIRMVLSVLPGRTLDNLRDRKWPTMEVKPLTDHERRKLIKKYLAQYQKELSETREERILASDQTRNPLFLRALLEELRVFGVHEHLDRAIEYYISSKSIPDLHQKVLKRLEGDYEREWPNLVEDAMTFIWASRRGLSVEELLDLLGTSGYKLPHAQWAQFYSAVEKLFLDRSGLIGFAHDYIRQAIQNRYLIRKDDQNSAHLHLADYFTRKEINPRMVDELPWQLSAANSWQRLYTLLTDIKFFRAAWDEDQFEIKTYWAKVVNSSDLSLVDAYQPVLSTPFNLGDFRTIMHISELLKHMGHLSEVFSLQNHLIEFYRETGEKKKLATSLTGQGVILFNRGDYDGAMELFKESERICRELDDKTELSKSLHNQGNIFYHHGDYNGAMELFREAECILRELGDRRRLSLSLSNQGIILSQRGDFNGAMELFKETERIFRELGDKSRLSVSLGNQGIILRERGDLDGAMKLYEEQERICRELGDKSGLSRSLANQGSILREHGDLDGAMTLYKEEERICRDLGDKTGLSRSLGNRGIILHKRGDLDGAMKLYKEEEHICRELDDKRGLSRSFCNQGDALKDLGELDKAMDLLKEAESIVREIGILFILVESLTQQADVLLRKGDPNKALPLAEESYELAEKHGFAEQTENSRTLLDKIHAQLVEPNPTSN